MLSYEKKFKRLGYDLIIGVDEAGRGPLAGPVVAAAVWLRNTDFLNRIDDSKKLSSASREKAFSEIKINSLSAVGIVGEKTIDRINILRATHLAAKKAVVSLLKKLKKNKINGRCCFLLDGGIVLDVGYPCYSIIRGDAKSLSIAAASILAKVTRDNLMLKYDLLYPGYGFAKHKGYPTKEHREVLKQKGPCKIHRLSFTYA